MSARTTSRKLPRWTVFRIGGTLGTIVAADEAEALSVACAEFYVEPADRKRIVVRPAG